jgi:ABC transporter substrate binding protein/Crp-like helix-turn-helix domain
MRRREFIATLGTLPAWPLPAGAQQRGQLRKLSVIMAVGKTPEYVAALAALEQALDSLGWKQGENLQIEDRWSAGSEEGARSAAQEIIGLKPDVIVGQSAAVIQALRSTSRTIPIVFLHVADPAVYGFVSNFARPEGNVTGITNIVPSIGAKWLQLLKEIAPDVKRAAMLVNPDTQPDRGAIFLNPFQAAARTLGVKSVNGEVHDFENIETVMAGLAKEAFAEEHPQVYKSLVELLAHRLRETDTAVAASSFLSLKGRVARTMLELADHFGQEVAPGRIVIRQKIGHNDLAAMAGIARENLTRVLNDWQRHKALSRLSGYYCLEDKTQLEHQAKL